MKRNKKDQWLKGGHGLGLEGCGKAGTSGQPDQAITISPIVYMTKFGSGLSESVRIATKVL